MSVPIVAGVEMGGTKCILLLVRGPDDILDRYMVATGTPAETLRAIEDRLDGWQRTPGFAALGIAAFGPLQLDPGQPGHGSIIATSKPGWDRTDILHRFAARYGVPVGLQTDVAAAALAEGRWGAARGLANHAYITVGTGVGVGLIVGGRPVAGMTHCEMGHIRVATAPGDNWPGICAFHGNCVEGLISGPALAARHGLPGAQIPPGHADWRLFEHVLAGLLHTLVLTLGPERIAVGGGVMSARPQLFPPLRERLARSLNGYGATARFMAEIDDRLGPPGLGVMAGPLGAIAVAHDRLGG